MAQVERRRLLISLKSGKRSRAARSLGLTPRQFGYRLRKLGLDGH